jgi:hypothetical protein
MGGAHASIARDAWRGDETAPRQRVGTRAMRTQMRTTRHGAGSLAGDPKPAFLEDLA